MKTLVLSFALALVASLAQGQHYRLILNLDDRLLSLNQATKDVRQILKIYKDDFGNVIRQNPGGFEESTATFQVLVAPQSGQPDFSAYEQALTLNLAKYPQGEREGMYMVFFQQLTYHLSLLYRLSMKNKVKASDYAGCDHYRFVLDRRIIFANTHQQTKVFWFSDGHFDYQFNSSSPTLTQGGYSTSTDTFLPELLRAKLNWLSVAQKKGYGILPTGKKFNDAPALVMVGFRAKTNSYLEIDILKWVWENWLRSQGFRTVTFIPDQELTSNNL